MSKENGIYKTYGLPPNVDRPLPLGTRISYLSASREVRSATVVQAGYYVLVVYNKDTTISIIRYADIVSVPLQKHTTMRTLRTIEQALSVARR
jgi:hypothetical protein